MTAITTRRTHACRMPRGTIARLPVDERVEALDRRDDARREARAARTACGSGASDDGERRRPAPARPERRRRPRRAAAGGARAAHAAVRHRAGRPGGRRALAHAHPGADRRGEPVRHPRDRARGVPRRLRRLGRDRLPGAAVLGRDVRPGARRADVAARSATTCARVGVHQGLAPVLDVVRDARWGRVEETIGEDPYLVGTIGTAYVRGLESAGVVATLKHFVGYSASTGGPQPRARVGRPARARRRAAAAVRDGDPRGRRARR